MRLRQVALVARDLEAVVEPLCAVLGIQVAFRDPGVAYFGLANAVMPVGDTFLEVVSPMQPGTTAGRYLERHGGDGGYMVMVQSDDFALDRARLEGLGVRIVWSAELDDIKGMHLHPRDVGGAILSLDQPLPPESWRWGGPEWRERISIEVCREITSVELESAEPQRLAARWAEVLAVPLTSGTHGYEICLERGSIRFLEGPAEGVAGFEVSTGDVEAVLERARRRGLPVADDQLVIGGCRIRPRPCD